MEGVHLKPIIKHKQNIWKGSFIERMCKPGNSSVSFVVYLTFKYIIIVFLSLSLCNYLSLVPLKLYICLDTPSIMHLRLSSTLCISSRTSTFTPQWWNVSSIYGIHFVTFPSSLNFQTFLYILIPRLRVISIAVPSNVCARFSTPCNCPINVD